MRFTVIHANVDPDLGGQDYANPRNLSTSYSKKPSRGLARKLVWAWTLMPTVMELWTRAASTSDNQILPMLLRYVGVDRGITGRVIATQTGSPLLEVLAGMIPNNELNKPAKGALPGYVGQKIYKCRVGDIASRSLRKRFRGSCWDQVH